MEVGNWTWYPIDQWKTTAGDIVTQNFSELNVDLSNPDNMCELYIGSPEGTDSHNVGVAKIQLTALELMQFVQDGMNTFLKTYMASHGGNFPGIVGPPITPITGVYDCTTAWNAAAFAYAILDTLGYPEPKEGFTVYMMSPEFLFSAMSRSWLFWAAMRSSDVRRDFLIPDWTSPNGPRYVPLYSPNSGRYVSYPIPSGCGGTIKDESHGLVDTGFTITNPPSTGHGDDGWFTTGSIEPGGMGPVFWGAVTVGVLGVAGYLIFGRK